MEKPPGKDDGLEEPATEESMPVVEENLEASKAESTSKEGPPIEVDLEVDTGTTVVAKVVQFVEDDSGPGDHGRGGGDPAELVKVQGNQDEGQTGTRGLPGAEDAKPTPGDQVEEPSNEASPVPKAIVVYLGILLAEKCVA